MSRMSPSDGKRRDPAKQIVDFCGDSGYKSSMKWLMGHVPALSMSTASALRIWARREQMPSVHSQGVVGAPPGGLTAPREKRRRPLAKPQGARRSKVVGWSARHSIARFRARSLHPCHNPHRKVGLGRKHVEAEAQKGAHGLPADSVKQRGRMSAMRGMLSADGQVPVPEIRPGDIASPRRRSRVGGA